MLSKTKNSNNNVHVEMNEREVNVQRREVDELLARVRFLEQQLKITQKDENSNLTDRFADQVAIIGLKEAVSFRRKSLKAVWVVLLLLGMGGTMYYIVKNTMDFMEFEKTTKITLQTKPSYKYPPLVLCSPWWFDFKRVLSFGLSEEALKYSLHYSDLLDPYVGACMKNATHAKKEFLDFFKKRNYTTLIDYYDDISADWNDDSDATENSTISFNCDGCVKKHPTTTIFSNAYCDVVELEDARANSSSAHLRLTNRDNTNGLLQRLTTRNFWLFDFLPNIRVGGPSIKLKSFHSHTVKLAIQNITMLDSCNGDPDYDQSDQVEKTENCLSEQDSLLKGSTFLTAYSKPSDTSNFFDNDAPDYFANCWNSTHNNKSIENERMNATTRNKTANAFTDDQLQDCYEKFKPPCNRLIFDVTLSADTMTADQLHITRAEAAHTSIIDININHAAVFQGGIITWEEMLKTTPGDFISNIGGTLGVFLGCSVLTLAQLVTSFVNYMLDKKSKNSASVRPTRELV